MTTTLNFIDILEQLEKTTGTNDKIALIKANANNIELKEYLRLALDKNVTFGISEIEDVALCDHKEFSFDIFTTLSKRLINRELTGNDARNAIGEILCHCTELQYKWIKKCLQKDLASIGIGQRLYEDAYDEKGFKFRLGLAEEQAELDKVEDGPGYLDKKANGVRTICVLEKTSLSAIYGGRNGLLAKNFYFIKDELEALTKAFAEKWQSCVFDGEVHVNDCLENTMTLYGFKWRTKEEFIGAKGKLKEKAWASYCEDEAEALKFKEDAKFVIFDFMTLDEWNSQDCKYTQKERKVHLENIKKMIEELGLQKIEVIETEYVNNKDEAIDAAQRWVDRGFEGGIFKPENGLYLWKRSRNWIKIKEVEDFEVIIMGFLPQKTKYNSDGTPKPAMVGKVICYDKYGNEHKIGTGKALSEKVREDMHNNPDNYLKKIATCSAQRPSDKSNKYICPRMDIIRLDRDSLED